MEKNLAFFSRRNKGMCGRLRGKVLVELIHVSDRESQWTKREKEEFYKKFREAMEEILRQAMAAGVSLTISSISDDYLYSGVIDEYKISSVFSDYVSRRGMSRESYSATRRAQYGVDEVAVMIVLEKEFRAFAQTEGQVEYSALSYKDDLHAISHELMHNFGAADLYYPYHVYALTMRHLPQSLMCTYEGMEVDALTRYLIGWTESLEPKAQAFLAEAGDYTDERYRQASAIEWARGREHFLMEGATPYADADELMTKALEGDVWAEYLWGICCRDGISVGRNVASAESYLRRSGRAGLTVAVFSHLELMLNRGHLTSKQKQDVADIFGFCYNEHPWLEGLKLFCLWEGIEIPKNEARAVKELLREYERRGNGSPAGEFQRALAFYRIAERLSERIPALHREIRRERERCELSVTRGEPVLQILVGRLLQEGKHVQRDEAGAKALFEIAAGSRSTTACLELARCYREGIGVARNEAKAREWEERSDEFFRENPWEVTARRFGQR